MKVFKKSVSIILTVLFSASVFSLCPRAAAAETDTAGIYKELLKKDDLSFSLNSEDGTFIFGDSKSGKTFLSNPADAQSNGSLKGQARTAAMSQLILSVVDNQGNVTEINSKVESVNRGGLKVYEDKEYVKCVYTFPNYKISIPVYYSLENGSLNASIKTKEIIAKDKNTILRSIRLLPYFAAASSADKGYFIVPDGCGAIIDFNSSKSPAYSQRLYGADRGKEVTSLKPYEQPALLPAVSTWYQDANGSSYGMVAYAKKGASLASAEASAGTEDGCYNTAGFSFIYRDYDNVTLMDRTTKATSVVMNEKFNVSCKEFAVSYTPVPNAENGFIALAETVRNKLFGKENKTNNKTMPVYVDTYISVRKTKYFLGIPYKGNQLLTSLDDCAEIINSFGDNPVIMTLNGLGNDGAVGGHIDKALKITRNAGKISDLKKLYETARKNGGNIYPKAEFTEFTKGGGKVTSVSNITVERPFFDYGTLEVKERYGGINLLKSDLILKNVNMWINSAKKQNIDTCAPLSLSYAPYRTGEKNEGDRNSTEQKFVKALQALKENNMSVLLSNPASYALHFADYISALPESDSGFAACKTDIPFLQIVMHGVKSYAISSVNLKGDTQSLFLKALETGASLSFTFTASDYEAVKETPLDAINGADFSGWKEDAPKLAEKLNAELSDAADCYIVNYEILTDGVRRVTYGNGVSFTVNYSDRAYNDGGISVEPKSYIKTETEGK